MNPVDVCKNILGKEKVIAVMEELSSPQIKAVLKEGNLRVKFPGSYVSQQKRRKLWTTKICAAVEEDNQEIASEILQQWLLHHRRSILIDFLDRLEVKHRHGESDESFLLSGSTEKIRSASSWLMTQYDPVEVVAYLRYIAYQQRSTVFDDWDGLDIKGQPPEEEPQNTVEPPEAIEETAT